MTLIVGEEAQAELDAAITWYEERQPSLGIGLLDEFRRICSDLESETTTGTRLEGSDYNFVRM